jgi:hypothetical protein
MSITDGRAAGRVADSGSTGSTLLSSMLHTDPASHFGAMPASPSGASLSSASQSTANPSAGVSRSTGSLSSASLSASASLSSASLDVRTNSGALKPARS